MEERYQRIREIAEKEMDCSAHDMEHVMRVYKLCLELAEGEIVDMDVLKSAALLHDIARTREDQDNSGAGGILKRLGYPEESISKIKACILSHRFRTGKRPVSKEARILFDADKLDVIGAVGVARAFMFAGKHNERMFSDTPVDEYIKLNHSEGKLNGRIKDLSKHTPYLEYMIKLRDIPGKLYTRKGREIAGERIRFMNDFFDRLSSEIRGEM